jgi:hypothetical protein
MLIAEELDADGSKIRVEHAPAGKVVAYEDPGDEQAENGIDDGGQQRRANANAAAAVGVWSPDTFGMGQRRRSRG